MSAAHAERQDPLLPAALACKDRYSPELLACVDGMLQLRATDRPQCIEEVFPVFDNTGEPPTTTTILSQNEPDWSYAAQTAPLTTHLSRPDATDSPQAIDQTLTDRLILQLAYHIGPISRQLVQQAIETNYDLEQIIDILVQELPSAVERERFRKQFAASQ
jgi:hypothetical protein